VAAAKRPRARQFRSARGEIPRRFAPRDDNGFARG
jgi:hypothetical protein